MGVRAECDGQSMLCYVFQTCTLVQVERQGHLSTSGPYLCVGYNCKSFTKASGVCLSAAGSDCCAA